MEILSRKPIVFVVALLFVLMLATTAAAAVTVQVNGANVTVPNPPVVSKGTVYLPSVSVKALLGADISVAGKTITVKKEKQVLVMTVGSTKAKLNGISIKLNRAPFIQKRKLLLPAQNLCSALGAVFNWNAARQIAAINYAARPIVQTVPTTADTLYAEASRLMIEANTVKIKGSMDMDMTVDDGKGSAPENMKSVIDYLMEMQQKPMYLFMKMNMKMNSASATEKLSNASSETIVTENGMYTNVENEGWYKLTGLDEAQLKKAIEASKSSDPLSSIQQMKDMGAKLVQEADQVRNGQTYWVINLDMDEKSVTALLSKSNPTFEKLIQPGANKGMSMRFNAKIYINQQTKLIDCFEETAFMNLPMTIGSATTNMKMDMKMSYDLYDYGKPITQIDVSQAKVKDLLAK